MSYYYLAVSAYEGDLVDSVNIGIWDDLDKAIIQLSMSQAIEDLNDIWTDISILKFANNSIDKGKKCAKIYLRNKGDIKKGHVERFS